MTPNTQKPTIEDCLQHQAVWHWQDCFNRWIPVLSTMCRKDWDDNNEDRWLPYSAIPDPNNTQQGETK